MRRLGPLLLLVAGCHHAPSSLGYDALLRVDNGQFYPGTPASSDTGPAVTGAINDQFNVFPGEVGFAIRGSLAPESTAVILSLEDDRGYWVLPANAPGAIDPDQPTFSATLSFSDQLSAGPRNLQVRAADASGHVGLPMNQPLQVAAPTPPTGPLVVTLTWSNESDLDLHVVEPDGTEIWSRNKSDYTPPPPGSPPAPPDAGATAAYLDVDSNANCVIDGRREENAVWQMPPASGHYIVRVDTFSLCGQVSANWKVEARMNDSLVVSAEGYSDVNATQPPHERGSGVVAVEFDIP